MLGDPSKQPKQKNRIIPQPLDKYGVQHMLKI
jgi:hypothetical protein